jgi:hypothetical protein
MQAQIWQNTRYNNSAGCQIGTEICRDEPIGRYA